VFLGEASRSKRRRDLLVGTWNVRSLYRAGSLTAAARELARYKSDLLGVQEVGWDKEDTVEAGDYSFLYGKGSENHVRNRVFVHYRIVSAVKRVKSLLATGCHI
jgi:hypothetical protein